MAIIPEIFQQVFDANIGPMYRDRQMIPMEACTMPTKPPTNVGEKVAFYLAEKIDFAKKERNTKDLASFDYAKVTKFMAELEEHVARRRISDEIQHLTSFEQIEPIMKGMADGMGIQVDEYKLKALRKQTDEKQILDLTDSRFDVSKLGQIRGALAKRSVRGRLFLAIHSNLFYNDLINDVKATSTDFQKSLNIISGGELAHWQDLNIILMADRKQNGKTVGLTSTTGANNKVRNRECFAWADTALGYTDNPMYNKVYMDREGLLDGDQVIIKKIAGGATIINPEGVLKINIRETQ